MATKLKVELTTYSIKRLTRTAVYETKGFHRTMVGWLRFIRLELGLVRVYY